MADGQPFQPIQRAAQILDHEGQGDAQHQTQHRTQHGVLGIVGRHRLRLKHNRIQALHRKRPVQPVGLSHAGQPNSLIQPGDQTRSRPFHNQQKDVGLGHDVTLDNILVQTQRHGIGHAHQPVGILPHVVAVHHPAVRRKHRLHAGQGVQAIDDRIRRGANIRRQPRHIR